MLKNRLIFVAGCTAGLFGLLAGCAVDQRDAVQFVTGGSTGVTGGGAGESGSAGSSGSSGSLGTAGKAGGSAGSASGTSGSGSGTAGSSGSTGTAGSGTSGSGVGGSGTSGSSGTGSSGTGSSGTGSSGTSGSSGSTGTAGTGTSGSAGSGTSGSGSSGTGSSGTGSAGTGTAGSSGAAGSGTAGAGGASGTVLFSDDFEDGDANGWTPTAGTWSVVTDGSKVYAETIFSASTQQFSATGSGWVNQKVRAKVKVQTFNGSSSSYFAGIFARYQSASSYYDLVLRSDLKMALRVNKTSVQTTNNTVFALDTWYVLELQAVGSTLTGTLYDSTGTTVISALTASDSSIPSGGTAVGTVNATAEFDDVIVTVP